MKYKSLIGISVAVAAMAVAVGFKNKGPEVGEAAPAFSLPASNGKTVTLEQYKGKYVVLEWWNNGCPFVKAHYNSRNMQDLQKWAKEKEVVWLSIVSSAPGTQGYVTADEANGFIKSLGMESEAVLLDPEGTVGKLYDAKTTPHMFIIDPKGTLLYDGAIDEGPQRDPEKIKSTKNFVRTGLEEAWAGKELTTKKFRPYGCNVKYKN